jgi:hypothetical protein
VDIASEGNNVMSSNIEIICEWLRHPDNAETFRAGDLVMWANDRPTGEALSLKREFETKDAIITELVGALEGAQKTLSMMFEPNAINSTTVVTAYSNCVAAENKCRTAITKAREHMK